MVTLTKPWESPTPKTTVISYGNSLSKSLGFLEEPQKSKIAHRLEISFYQLPKKNEFFLKKEMYPTAFPCFGKAASNKSFCFWSQVPSSFSTCGRWCKLDLDDLEVDQWLELKSSKDCGTHPSLCVPFSGDSQFFPKGIPKVVVSMKSEALKHSRKIFEKMEKRYQEGNLPNPIIFEKMYKSRSEIANGTQFPCLLGL